jgi:hypothetical protein
LLVHKLWNPAGEEKSKNRLQLLQNHLHSILVIGKKNKIVIDHRHQSHLFMMADGEKDKKVINHLQRTIIIGENKKDIKEQLMIQLVGVKRNIRTTKILMIQVGSENEVLIN